MENQKYRRAPAVLPAGVSRERAEALERLGPWDRECDWAPTPEMVKRASASRPAWVEWNRDLVQSIDRLRLALILRCGSRAQAFQHDRFPRRGDHEMSPEDREAYDGYLAWLAAMHDAGLKADVIAVCDIVLENVPCRDQARFRRAIELHAEVCRRGAVRRPPEPLPTHLQHLRKFVVV